MAESSVTLRKWNAVALWSFGAGQRPRHLLLYFVKTRSPPITTQSGTRCAPFAATIWRKSVRERVWFLSWRVHHCICKQASTAASARTRPWTAASLFGARAVRFAGRHVWRQFAAPNAFSHLQITHSTRTASADSPRPTRTCTCISFS